MALQYTPVILPLLLSGAATSVLGFYAWRRRRSAEGIVAFALLTASVAVYALGDALWWSSVDLEWKYFWVRLRRPGAALSPIFWLVFATQYTGFGRLLTRRRLALLSLVPIADVLLSWTNPWHHLVWSDVSLVEWHGVTAIKVSRGPLWTFLAAYSYPLLLGGAGMIVVALVRSPERYRGQALALLSAVLVPLATISFGILHPSAVDTTPMATAVSAAAIAWGIFRHRLLDTIPAARHTIIEHMSDAMIVLDASHRLVDLNPAARRVVGTSGRAAIGRPIVEVLPESTRVLGAAIAGTELRETEIALDGREYEVRVSPVRNKDGTVSGRVVLLHDITEQKQTRERLRQSVEASRVILESIEDGYYEIDRRGNMTATTDVTARIGGLASKEEAIGRNFVEFTDAASAQRLISTFNSIYQTGEAVNDIEYPFTTPAGVGKSIEMSATVKRDTGGKVIGFRGMLRDVTERKRAAAELARAKRTAEEASQAKGAFLATVSHELRTPLTSVLGFAKLIKRRMGETVRPGMAATEPKVQRALTQVADNVEIIVAEGERLTALINDVLDLAKIESGKVEWHMQPVDVGEIVARAIAATTSLSEAKNLALRTEIENALPTIVGDPDRLIQVVINLLSNAIKFTESGSITCRVRRIADVDPSVRPEEAASERPSRRAAGLAQVSTPPSTELRTGFETRSLGSARSSGRTEGERSGEVSAIEVSVTDTGTGIAPQDQAKVFEQFVQVGDTLTDKPTGTGLGLPICKQIVEHHGGRIWVESEVGRGSKFSFIIPLNGAATEATNL